MNCIEQVIGENYALYHGDCVEVLKGIPDQSIGYSIFSPPFASLYTYSNSPRDMGNCRSNEALNELKADGGVFKVFYDLDDNMRVLYKMKDGKHFGLY